MYILLRNHLPLLILHLFFLNLEAHKHRYLSSRKRLFREFHYGFLQVFDGMPSAKRKRLLWVIPDRGARINECKLRGTDLG